MGVRTTLQNKVAEDLLSVKAHINIRNQVYWFSIINWVFDLLFKNEMMMHKKSSCQNKIKKYDYYKEYYFEIF